MVMRTFVPTLLVLGSAALGTQHTSVNTHCERPFLSRPSAQDAEADFPLDVKIGMKASTRVLYECALGFDL